MTWPRTHSPGNRFGFGSPEYYEYERKYGGFKTTQEWALHEKSIRPKCPVCGIPYGFAWSTGDCGCLDDGYTTTQRDD